jgi:hypothetical protein
MVAKSKLKKSVANPALKKAASGKAETFVPSEAWSRFESAVDAAAKHGPEHRGAKIAKAKTSLKRKA